MFITIAECSVVYTGRGDTTLGPARRAVIVKDDGAVSIHSDKGNKPLNYMGAPNVLTKTVNSDGNPVWSFDTRKESLQVTFLEVFETVDFPLGDKEPGLVRDGTEDQLQAWLAERPEQFGEGYSLVQREYQTGAGPVDLLFRHEDGHMLAVEVKRVAMLGAVDQILRYLAELQEEYSVVRGAIAALDIRPKTMTQAVKKNVDTFVIDWDRGSSLVEAEQPDIADADPAMDQTPTIPLTDPTSATDGFVGGLW